MTDRELLELAAKAVGITIIRWGKTDGAFIDKGASWSPLIDDGDALRISISLHLNIEYVAECDTVYVCGSDESAKNIIITVGLGDIELRRAIVIAAAEIGKAMK